MGECLGGGLVDAAEDGVEDGGEVELAVVAVGEGELGGDGDAGQANLAGGGGAAQCAEEAGGPAGGQELLGVVAVPAPPSSLGRARLT
ncbi:hypothetical protein ACZ91_28360 [Streptomyces regensis]|nr:hypothetical protein ACZ91_28360 [Streptomyces regensis]